MNAPNRIRSGLVLLAAVAATSWADTAPISPADAGKYVGQRAQVCGIVASATHATGSRGQPTFLNLTKAHPNHIFTAVIWGNDRDRFQDPPENLQGQRICVSGRVELYKGRPQIIVSSPTQVVSE